MVGIPKYAVLVLLNPHGHRFRSKSGCNRHHADGFARCPARHHHRVHDHGEQQRVAGVLAFRALRLERLVGVTIVFSTESRLKRGGSAGSLVPHIFQRFAILFALGVFLALFPLFHWSNIRVYGVLQRIALCYLVCALLYLWDRRLKNPVAPLVVLLELQYAFGLLKLA